jgi:hypothetical protein
VSQPSTSSTKELLLLADAVFSLLSTCLCLVRSGAVVRRNGPLVGPKTQNTMLIYINNRIAPCLSKVIETTNQAFKVLQCFHEKILIC